MGKTIQKNPVNNINSENCRKIKNTYRIYISINCHYIKRNETQNGAFNYKSRKQK